MNLFDVSSFTNQTIPPPEFYVQDLLPKNGLMLLFGSPKIGKSWLSKQLAFSIATGDDFLGFRTNQAKVLIVQFEISIRAYQWRLKRLLDVYSLNQGYLYVSSPGQMYIEDDNNFQQLSNLFVSVMPNVLILDCLQSCFGGDENDSKEIGKFMERIESLKMASPDLQTSVVIVHHSRKAPSSTSSFSEVARGQSKLTGWVDTLVHMVKQPSGIQLQFMARQSTHELNNLNIQFNGIIFERR